MRLETITIKTESASIEEVKRAIKCQKGDKVTGIYTIPPKLLK